MNENPRSDEIAFANDALSVEGALTWARRVVAGQSELPELLDELAERQVRQLVGRLIQVIGLLELQGADVDGAEFVSRAIGLGYDYAFDPWATGSGDAGVTK